jgi:tetratricopeptide (TPR) repeat protein
MPATIDHFTRSDVLRMVGLTPSQLDYWEHLELIRPRIVSRKKVYTFGDLVSLRAVKQLKEQRVPAGVLRHALDALRQELAQVEIPLTALRIHSSSGKVVVEYQGVALEPLSGQLLMNFESRRLGEKVSSMADAGPEAAFNTSFEASFEDGFTLALEYEGCPELRLQAIDAYRRVLAKFPDAIEPRLNLGTLLYEQGDLAGAAEEFRSAVRRAPKNPLAHFNLGTALEDLGELEAAARHLGEALRLKPEYADAHYNLARVCEKLNTPLEALGHWRRYLELDPHSRWAQYARQRLGMESHSS